MITVGETKLINYMNAVQEITELSNKINLLETDISSISKQIEGYEALNMAKAADILAEAYNELTKKCIVLRLKKNRLEHDILQFEYEEAISE